MKKLYIIGWMIVLIGLVLFGCGGDGSSSGGNDTGGQDDNDGDGYTESQGDCDDINSAFNPATVWYQDSDDDGYSDSTTQTQCQRPIGYKLSSELTSISGDCNDQDNTIHPNAADLCGDGIDQDCDPEACSIQLPDLTDMIQVDALTKIAEIEMTEGTISQECSNTIANGMVLQQSPAAGTIVEHGEAVDLVVSTLCDTENSIDMHFKFINAGGFTMGSLEDEPGRGSDETQHTVTLTRPLYIQTTEVTQRQWKAVIGANIFPSYFPECGDDCPMDNVTWYDSVIFCNRLSQNEGLTPSYYADDSYTTVFDGTPPVTSGDVYWKQDANGYRLPTESEWEYAARAGATTAFANGDFTSYDLGDPDDCYYDPNLDAMGWYCGNSSVSYKDCYPLADWGGPECAGIQPVGQKNPNDWGLHDMHGNVWEWCHDWYSEYPSDAVVDPVGPSSGTSRVIRGGSWFDGAGYCRAAYRSLGGPGGRGSGLGFRLVVPPGQPIQ